MWNRGSIAIITNQDKETCKAIKKFSHMLVTDCTCGTWNNDYQASTSMTQDLFLMKISQGNKISWMD